LIVLGAPTEYNKQALSFFCRCGFFLSDDTPFRHIHTLPPSAELIWRNGELSINSQKRINHSADLTMKQAVEGYIELFRKAMDKYQPSNEQFILPLSGGRDSRQMLLELWRINKLPKELVTCGDIRDITVARIFADKLKISHKILSGNNKYKNAVIRKNVITQFCALEHTWLMELGDYIVANYAEAYEGTGVGVITRSDFLTKDNVERYHKGKFKDIALWSFNKYGPSEDFFKYLPKEFDFLIEDEAAINLFENELQGLSTAANPLSCMSFWNWCRRAISLWPFGICSRIKRVNTPFLDRDLYDFLSSLTPEMILQNEPQALAVRKAFPEFAEVPFYEDLPKINQKIKKNIYKSILNISDKIAIVAQYCHPNLLALLKASLSNEFSKRSMFGNIIIYLSQLSYCSRKENASKMLDEFEALDAAIINTYKAHIDHEKV
jgi:hypothetical protein